MQCATCCYFCTLDMSKVCRLKLSSHSVLILNSWDCVAVAVVPFTAKLICMFKLKHVFTSNALPDTTLQPLGGGQLKAAFFGVSRLGNVDTMVTPGIPEIE